MSWMTSSGAGAGAGAAVDGPGTADGTAEGTGSAPDMAALLLRSEDLGEVVAAALHPDQSDAEVGRAVLHRVQHPLPGKLDGEGVRPAVVGHLCPGRAQPRDELGGAVGDLHQQDPAELERIADHIVVIEA